MEISALQRAVRAADLPLDKLAASESVSQKEKVAEVSRQFEAVLLRQILSQAQKPLFKNSLMQSDGATNAIYQDLIAEQLADRISRGGTFGFAKVLEKQLSVEYGVKKSAEPELSTKDATPIEEKIKKYKSPAIQPGKRI